MDYARLLFVDGMVAVTLIFPSLLVGMAAYTRWGPVKAVASASNAPLRSASVA